MLVALFIFGICYLLLWVGIFKLEKYLKVRMRRKGIGDME